MKKILFILLVTFTMLIPSKAFSQKGEKTVGILGGYNTRTESALVGISFQYRFSKYFRLAPDFGILIRNKHLSSFQFNGNAQFPIKMDTRLNFYPFVGITYQSWRNSAGDENFTKNYFGANFGGGFEYMASPTLKLSVEGKYSLIKTYPNASFSLGIGYLF